MSSSGISSPLASSSARGSVLVVDRDSPLGCDRAWTRDAEDQRNELG
jgi:hypothetical protein